MGCRMQKNFYRLSTFHVRNKQTNRQTDHNGNIATSKRNCFSARSLIIYRRQWHVAKPTNRGR